MKNRKIEKIRQLHHLGYMNIDSSDKAIYEIEKRNSRELATSLHRNRVSRLWEIHLANQL